MHRSLTIRSPALAIAVVAGLALAAGCGAEEADSEGAKSPVDSEGAKSSPDSEEAKSPDDVAHPLLGHKGPDFSRKTVTGHDTVSLHSLAGKVAIVDFWATWCVPCKKSFPKLEALNAKYQENGLKIVGISEDDDNDGISSFASDLGAQFPVIWDENKAIASKWQPKSMPTTFVVDRKGTVRFVHLGYHDGEETEIEREVKSLL
jgi:cytochrome c biogenesis protein CcmG, thiol:disulfide interchange protein DsbE